MTENEELQLRWAMDILLETAREIACRVFVRDFMGLTKIPLMMRYA
jgi:hypothetical protein